CRPSGRSESAPAALVLVALLLGAPSRGAHRAFGFGVYVPVVARHLAPGPRPVEDAPGGVRARPVVGGVLRRHHGRRNAPGLLGGAERASVRPPHPRGSEARRCCEGPRQRCRRVSARPTRRSTRGLVLPACTVFWHRCFIFTER